ncbi:thioredoxin family protein [Thiomicrospira sp.]|uniref:thioredoxin family protein n=1 Tax=Thiomicrospira sp. TaxID=935 RepID=UPI002F944304
MKKFALILLALIPGLVIAQPSMEVKHNLYQVGQQALQDNKPIVIFFNASYCLPCEKLKSRALNAIIRFEQYPAGTRFIEVFIDSPETLTDFYNQTTSPEEFALFHNIVELPSLVFLDGEGNELARPIMNNGAYDFFGHLLNSRLEVAIQELEAR